MIMKALLNGSDSIQLHANDTINVEYFPGGMGDMSYLVISRPSCGWRVQLDDIRPNHLSRYTTSLKGDFSFFYWEPQDMLCLAGYKRFYAVNGISGQIIASKKLEFTDKESLDLLALLVSASSEKFIVVSTKLAFLIEQNKEGIREIIIPGLAESVVAEQNRFKITYIDTAKLDLSKNVLVVD